MTTTDDKKLCRFGLPFVCRSLSDCLYAREERMGHGMGQGKCEKITAHPSRLAPLKKKRL
jgi:hypothetical protein